MAGAADRERGIPGRGLLRGTDEEADRSTVTSPPCVGTMAPDPSSFDLMRGLEPYPDAKIDVVTGVMARDGAGGSKVVEVEIARAEPAGLRRKRKGRGEPDCRSGHQLIGEVAGVIVEQPKWRRTRVIGGWRGDLDKNARPPGAGAEIGLDPAAAKIDIAVGHDPHGILIAVRRNVPGRRDYRSVLVRMVPGVTALHLDPNCAELAPNRRLDAITGIQTVDRYDRA